MADFRNSGTNRFSGGHGGHGGGFAGRGGRPSFGNKGGFRGGDRDRGPVTMHQAICDQCKKPCEVPFQPTAGKPVYCKDCFGGKRETGGGDRGVFQKKSFGDYKTPPRTDFGNDIKKVSGEEIKKQIEVLNVKIDRLAGMIEKMNMSQPAEVKIEKVEKVKKVAKIKKAGKK